MNKKSSAILGIPIAVVSFLLWFFIIGPALDKPIEDILLKLGSDSLCPSEFQNEQYKICFNVQGDVIADGKVNENLLIQVDGTSDSCHIVSGEYDFEFTGCQLEKFKQLEAYSLILVSNKGKVTVKGTELAVRIAESSNIVKLTPKNIRWLRRLSYFIRF